MYREALDLKRMKEMATEMGIAHYSSGSPGIHMKIGERYVENFNIYTIS